MSRTSTEKQKRGPDDFADQAEGRQTGLVGELLAFLRQTRKWWLAPAILMLLLVGVVVVLGGTAVAPLIYTLF